MDESTSSDSKDTHRGSNAARRADYLYAAPGDIYTFPKEDTFTRTHTHTAGVKQVVRSNMMLTFDLRA